jgi:hypothetical protein
MHDDDRARKPYKTYKSGRARRSSVDEELSGARPPRQRQSRSERPSGQNGGGYRRYGNDRDRDGRYNRYESAAAPGDGGRRNGQRQAKRGVAPQGTAPRQRRRFRWWHLTLTLLLIIVIAGVVATVLAWPGDQTLNRAVTKSNNRLATAHGRNSPTILGGSSAPPRQFCCSASTARPGSRRVQTRSCSCDSTPVSAPSTSSPSHATHA